MITMNYPVIDVERTGQRLRKLARDNHVTDQDVAGYLGFTSPRAIYKWYKGECLPTIDSLFALSKLYGVSIDEMIVEVEQSK